MAADEARSKRRAALPWIREVVVIAVVYLVYSFVRNQFGSANLKVGDAPRHAFNNAIDIIHFERAIGLFHEQSIQQWFLHSRLVIQFFNIFYGTAHFAVTLGVLIWIFVRKRADFGRGRTTLMATTVLALIGFALFPLMPPRLLNAYAHEPNCELNPKGDCYRYGGGELALEMHEPDFGFVDTLRQVGGLWSFDSKKLDTVSNQYAAMPSLHIGWSTWCALVLFRFAKKRWVKGLAVIYPVLTLTVIVATANHYIIDAAGGLAILAGGYLIAIGVERARERMRPAAEARVPENADDDIR
jgi:hypothetical protein